MPRLYKKNAKEHPTSPYRDMMLLEKKTRPLTHHAANRMMNCAFLLLKAFKSDPPDNELILAARQKAEEAMVMWRKSNGNPSKRLRERTDARRRQQSTPIEDPNPGSQP